MSENEVNAAMYMESKFLHQKLSYKHFVETVFLDTESQDVDVPFTKSEEMIEAVKNNPDKPFMLHIRGHLDKLDQEIPVLPVEGGNCHLDFSLWTANKFYPERLEEILKLNHDRCDCFTVFFRFNTDSNLQDQVDRLELVLEVIEIMKDKKISLSMSLNGDAPASFEMERMRFECVRRFYDEGFKIIALEFQIDYHAIEMHDEWKILGDVVAGTDIGLLMLRMTDGEHDVEVLQNFMSNFIDKSSGFFLEGSIATFHMVGLKVCKCRVTDLDNSSIYLFPNSNLLELAMPLSDVGAALSLLKNPSFEEIKLYGKSNRFTEQEIRIFLSILNEVLPRYTQIVKIMFGSTEIQDYSEEGKRIYNQHILPRLPATE